MPLLNFTFEELPLVLHDGYEAGLINGSAELLYSHDGSWCVRHVALDGHRLATYSEEEKFLARIKGKTLPRFRCTDVALESINPLYAMISRCLEGRWASRVQDAVREQIESDREGDLDRQAEDRMDRLREERV